ncbi:MAG: FHA domain-containing protein [Cyanobacteria bacterium P01_F01_bin.86]
MIVCPNCNHQNPDGAVQCEACYTPLPALASCPNCGASVQSDASFCGQCGFNLKSTETAAVAPQEEETFVPVEATLSSQAEVEIPDLVPFDPLVTTEPVAAVEASVPSSSAPMPSLNGIEVPPPLEEPSPSSVAAPVGEVPQVPVVVPSEGYGGATQIQSQQAKLLHVQTDTILELQPQLALLHIGKPNDRVPPNIDVSGFPNSEIVSRVHADIRVEGDVYYIEDVGSSNGTYINNMPLAPGNRHRLRPGDKVALGKGDKVTFIFQIG